LADIYEQQDRSAEAFEALERLLLAGSRSTAHINSYGHAAFRVFQLRRATAVLEKIFPDARENIAVNYWLFLLLLAQGRLLSSLSHYRQLCRISPRVAGEVHDFM